MRRPAQPSLLDWEPPETVRAFPAELVRGATLAARIARAVSVALAECKRPRDQIAADMSAWLGETVSVDMLNAYASPARAQHKISLPRYLAVIHATGDRRLLELLAEPFDWAVIERKHLPMIELAAAREQKDAMDRIVDAARRKARVAGGLR